MYRLAVKTERVTESDIDSVETSDRNRKLVKMRFIDPIVSRIKVACYFRISETRVTQIEKAVLKKIKKKHETNA